MHFSTRIFGCLLSIDSLSNIILFTYFRSRDFCLWYHLLMLHTTMQDIATADAVVTSTPLWVWCPGALSSSLMSCYALALSCTNPEQGADDPHTVDDRQVQLIWFNFFFSIIVTNWFSFKLLVCINSMKNSGWKWDVDWECEAEGRISLHLSTTWKTGEVHFKPVMPCPVSALQ